MKNGKFKKQRNLLQDFILKESSKEYSKQTIKGLFRSILEPLTEVSSQEALVLVKIKDTENVDSVIKRLGYTSVKMYFFSNEPEENNFQNIQKEDLWDDVEFVIVLAPRYSAALLWDYSTAAMKDCSDICLLYNSRNISDITKIIAANSKIDLDEYLVTYAPDRRENELLNSAINRLAQSYDDVNSEFFITEAEKENLTKTEDLLKDYEYTSDKAKMISHEIKNHLSIIDLYSKIAEKRLSGVALNTEVRESVENAIKSIKYSAYSITQFVNELKVFAKPILVEKKLNSIIEDVVTLTLPKARENSVQIEANVKENVRVHVDEIKIQSVIINLIYNAIEAIQENGRVVLECTEVVNNCARVLVSDNGAGIPKQLHDEIFEEGFTTKLTGNGLGLYICKNLMKEQYGDIRLMCSNEAGTQFEILIPII